MQYKQPKFYLIILLFLLFTNTIVSAAEGTSFTRLHKGASPFDQYRQTRH